MIEHRVIHDSYNQGVEFLESQTSDGSYMCFEHPRQDRDLEIQGRLTPAESFSSAIVADLLQNQDSCRRIVEKTVNYLTTQERNGHFTFFEDTTLCPPDTDTTSLGYTVLAQAGKIDQATLNKAVDNVLEATDADGAIQVWLPSDDTRPNRKDPVVTANALHLFHTAQRQENTQINEQWLGDVLRNQKFLEGTRYYHSPDTFLHFFGRLMLDFPEVRERHEQPLRQALSQRTGSTNHTIDVAMRAILATNLNMQTEANAEITNLLSLQTPGGWWPADAFYRGGERYYGSRVLTTAFSLKALSGQIHR